MKEIKGKIYDYDRGDVTEEHNEYLKNKDSQRECSVCSCDFDIDGEGGVDGAIGILPVAFCPTCYSGICDMCSQLEDSMEGRDAMWDAIDQLKEEIELLKEFYRAKKNLYNNYYPNNDEEQMLYDEEKSKE